MQSQHHLYGAGNQPAGYPQAAGYAGHAGMNMQPAAGQYNHVVMMPVNHGMPQPGTHPQYTGYPGRDGASMIYGGQPTGMVLPAQPMQQGQRSATVPQVTTTHCSSSCDSST